MNKYEKIDPIMQALKEQGWVCPEYQEGRRTSMGYTIPDYYGTIARKGEWTFVAKNHLAYVEELAIPRGRNWGLFYRGWLVDSGRNLKPAERVVKRVVEKAEMPVEKLVAMVLSTS